MTVSAFCIPKPTLDSTCSTAKAFRPKTRLSLAKLPSKKWWDVILEVWHTYPLICPHCQSRMRMIAVLNQRNAIEKSYSTSSCGVDCRHSCRRKDSPLQHPNTGKLRIHNPRIRSQTTTTCSPSDFWRELICHGLDEGRKQLAEISG